MTATEIGAPSDLRTRVDLPFPQAVESTRAALQEQGFGVLSEIRVDEALREKIGVEFRPYVILGACNPQLAHQALEHNLEIGLRLPCNVIVYEEDGGSVVSVMDPLIAIQGAEGEGLKPVAHQARKKLAAAVQALRSGG